MRLLLDECVPRPIKRELIGHDVHHVVDMGWSSKRNGELLRLMLHERFIALPLSFSALAFVESAIAASRRPTAARVT